MINEVALMTLGGGSRATSVILELYQVWGGRRHELNVKRKG